jgi:hypothetical protein
MTKRMILTARLALMALFVTLSLALGACDMDNDEGIEDGVGIEEGVGDDEVDD